MASGRMKATCTECRRRKQKCSGSWPCRHCTDRKVIPRCHFRLEELGVSPTETTRASKRGRQAPPTYERTDTLDQASNGALDLKALGYANTPADLSSLSIEASTNGDASAHDVDGASSGYDSHLQDALHALPPRSLTDYLVEYYLRHLNMTYCVIHYDSFMSDYQQYCKARMAGAHISTPFVCLLLQVCANTLQEVSGTLQDKVEYELGESLYAASLRLCTKADALSRTISPGSGGVHQSLQLLEAATWLKGDGKIKEAWHALARAVREEQECNMNRSDYRSSLSNMDRELRTRIWCYTILWDWQMAHWLDRPMLTENREPNLRTPNLEIDRSPNGAPSPFTNVFVQYKLLHTLRTSFGRLDPDADPNTVHDILKTIAQWISELPSELSWEAPNTEWDEQCRRILIQRLQLHTFVEMVRFTPLKPYLIQAKPQTQSHVDMRQKAARCAIECIHAAVEYLTVIEPFRTRFHFVTFALFDTATTIISAVLHNSEGNLPNTAELMDASFLALRALQNIARSTVFANNATRILIDLVSRLPPCWRQRLRTCGFESDEELSSQLHSDQRMDDHSTKASSSTPELESGSQLLSKVLDVALTPPSGWFPESLGEFDLDGVEQIWDWESLDFGLAHTIAA